MYGLYVSRVIAFGRSLTRTQLITEPLVGSIIYCFRRTEPLLLSQSYDLSWRISSINLQVCEPHISGASSFSNSILNSIDCVRHGLTILLDFFSGIWNSSICLGSNILTSFTATGGSHSTALSNGGPLAGLSADRTLSCLLVWFFCFPIEPNIPLYKEPSTAYLAPWLVF